VRFSRSRAQAFGAAAAELTRLARNGEAAAPASRPGGSPSVYRGPAPKRCDQCSKVVPHWSSVCPDCLKKRQLLVRLLRYALPFWPLATAGLLLMLLLTAVDMAPPYLSKVMVDDVSGARNYTLLKWVAFGILGINAVSAALGGVRGYLMTALGQMITVRIRQETYDHLQRLGLRYYDEQQTGQLLSRVTHDAGKTTLINLLCRFYDVQQGAMRLDGVDLRDVTQTSLRRQIGIVLQEPYLFHPDPAIRFERRARKGEKANL